MVRRTRKIVWTTLARESRALIFLYWNQRNSSANYSKKLNFLFQESLKQVNSYPESSIQSNKTNVRLKVASHFQIIYHVTSTKIIVLDIWDTRQNPENFPVK